MNDLNINIILCKSKKVVILKIQMLYLIDDSMKKTYFNILSYEIIDKIWRTNHLTCAILIQKAFKKKITYLCKEITQHISMFEYYNVSPYHYLYKHKFNIMVNKKSYNKHNLFRCFASCNCCERHNIDKPKILGLYTESKDSINYKIYECKCLCRHITRQMCRKIGRAHV